MLSKRQEQIIQKSIKLIDSKGIQGFTIKNLAKEIGITEPAIYRHFDSKNEILFTMLNGFKYFMTEIFNAVLKTENNTLEKIRLVFRFLLTKFTEEPGAVSIIFADEIFKSERLLAEKISEIMKANEAMFLSLITEGQANNEIRTDVEKKYITLMIMGTFRLLVKKWEQSKYTFNLLTEGEKLYQALNVVIKNNTISH